LALGEALVGVAHAAIDISDGLLQDLGHILHASQVGACVYFADLPVAAALIGLPVEPLRQAVLGGGDGYELCFTAPPSQAPAIHAAATQVGIAVTRIGRIEAGAALTVLDTNHQPLSGLPHGFDHFRAA
jgi:thiamine-monophosphate kinase